MSRFMPHHIGHLELIVELQAADQEFPSKLKHVRDVSDIEVPYYLGIHRATFKDGSIFYIKNSDGLAKPFAFEDESTCNAHLDFYKHLREIEFYHPETRFIMSEGEHGFRILCASPELSTTLTKDRKKRLESFPVIQYGIQGEKILTIAHREYFHGDIFQSRNYGATESGVLYYHDLHIFKSVPSELVHMIR
jgi:hypothetical protein